MQFAPRRPRVLVCSVFVDYHRRGDHKHGVLQPQAAPLIAALLPPSADVEILNDSWEDPDFSRAYDLVFLSSLNPDFDRARQLSHYWRKRGAKTVIGGTMASAFPRLCMPWFDAVCVGDAEGTVARVYDDFVHGRLEPLYVSPPYDPARVPTPRFDLMARANMFPIALEGSRGCTFSCDFCVLTGLGVRYHGRPVEDVVRDIRVAIDVARRTSKWWEWHKRHTIIFYDNNLGGDKQWLGALADALAPLGMYWGGPISFDALQDEALVEKMGRAGCLSLYTGLETFNPDALAHMHKRQNVLGDVRRVVDRCRAAGIMIDTGLLINPVTDTPAYVRRIPELMAASGIHVPTFVAFESPIPGTPHFRSLAAQSEPALLPNALLRDFTGYTLVTRPRRATTDELVDAYRWVCGALGSRRAHLRKLAHDIPRMLARGHWTTAITDIVDHWIDVPELRPDATRSLLAGTDTPPPEHERIPFDDSDFASEGERAAVCEPWRVTDESGRVLPHWLGNTPVFGPGGRVRATVANITRAPSLPLATAPAHAPVPS